MQTRHAAQLCAYFDVLFQSRAARSAVADVRDHPAMRFSVVLFGLKD
jgi:hypothetical protein